jgi:hypothetical protein
MHELVGEKGTNSTIRKVKFIVTRRKKTFVTSEKNE